MKFKRLIKANLGILFAFCFFLYPPTVNSLPLISYIIAYGIPFIYILVNRSYFKQLKSSNFKFFLFLTILLLIMSIFVPLIYGTMDFSYLMVTTYFFRKIIIYLFLLCLIIKKHGSSKSFEYFLYYYALTNAIYVIGTVLLVMIPVLKNAWFSIFENTSMESLSNSYGYTFRIGWQGFSGFRSTLYCTMSVIFALYLKYKLEQISAWQFAVLLLGNIIGNMFYGRIGLILTIPIVIAAIVFWNRKKIKQIVVFGIFATCFMLFVGMIKNVPIFHDWYVWMSTPIINVLKTGNFNNASFDMLINIDQVDISTKTLLMGDGYYNYNGYYYMRTDIGYIRNVLFWGMFGAIASYFLTLYSVCKLQVINKLLFYQFLIVFLVFEYKGAAYYEFVPILFIAYYAFILKNNQKLEKKND